jgi:hypothetical protein
MVMRAAAMVRTNSKLSIGATSAIGVPGIGTRLLIGTDSGRRIEVGQLDDQCRAVAARLAHADDSAGADLDAGFAHLAQGIDAVGVLVGGDHLSIERGIGIEVVVVVVETGFLEFARPGRP